MQEAKDFGTIKRTQREESQLRDLKEVEIDQEKDTGGSWVPSSHEPSGGLGIMPHSPGLPRESWWGSLDPAPPTQRLVEFHADSDTGMSVSPRRRGSESLFSMYLHRYNGGYGEAVMKVAGQTLL